MTLDAAHACVVDLDGVVWLEGSALPGATEGVSLLRAHSIPVLFATNNSMPTVAELVARLGAIGITARADEIVTSSLAAASLLARGDRALVVGEAGLRAAVTGAGCVETAASPDVVVVGLSQSFDYAMCDVAATGVREGARFIATNLDPTLPVEGTLRPGAGAIVAAISTAAGLEPEVAGKPSATMAHAIRARIDVGAVVGDRASTDGALAALLGVPFAHVASSVDDGGGADVQAGTLLGAVRALLG